MLREGGREGRREVGREGRWREADKGSSGTVDMGEVCIHRHYMYMVVARLVIPSCLVLVKQPELSVEPPAERGGWGNGE